MRSLSTLVQQALWAAVIGSTVLLPSLSHAAPGDLDLSFAPPNLSTVDGIAFQPDGNLVVTGVWNSLGAGGHFRMARLGNVTGTLDESYTSTADYNIVHSARFQSDGKLLIAGGFNEINGVSRKGMARLNADGTLDTTFVDPSIDGPNGNFDVYSIVLQPNGKIIIAGYFNSVGGVTRNNLARLNADGTLDSSFNPNPNNSVYSMAILPDGRILVTGVFTTIAGSTGSDRRGFAVLNANGALASTTTPVNNGAGCVAVQADGKILLAGFNGITRLNTDFTIDTSFVPDVLPNSNSSIATSMALQADGKIVISGGFQTVGGVERNRAARLNADGTLDLSFNPNLDDLARAAAIQADGKILIGGLFTKTGSTTRVGLARYENTLPTETLSVTSSARIEWLRGGTAPEASRVVFSQSTDAGATWTDLGNGTRIPGGWELTGLSLPTNIRIRASALTDGGYLNGSGGLMQTVEDFPFVPPALIVEQPADTPLAPGASVNFGQVVTGLSSSPFLFKLKNTGSGLLKRLQFSVEGAQASEFTLTPPSGSSITAGGSITLSIVFTPGAKLVRNATLRVGSNDPTNPIFTIPLTGTGIASPNADLIGIDLPPQMTLSPAFSANTLNYSTSAFYNRRSISFVPTALNAISGITVNGVAVASGAASAPINLAVGANVITLLVTAENGVNTKTYTLTVNRAAVPLPGEIDLAFNPFVDHWVTSLLQQSDGKLVLGGNFSNFVAPQSDAANTVLRNYFGRLNSNGSLDSFNSSLNLATFGYPVSMQLLGNGQMLAAGVYYSNTPVQNTAKKTIVLLNDDGSSVATFDPVANDDILQIALAPGGDILMAGKFTTVQGTGAASPTTRNYIARLNATGTLDTAFNASPNGFVASMGVQADGKVIIAGAFTMVGTTARNKIARLTTTGAIDTTFTPTTNLDGDVKFVLVQPNGQILVGGAFTAGDGLVRFNANGSLDTAFNIATPIGGREVYTLALQEDGKILMGGYGYNGHSSLERINTDGSVDASFTTSVRNITVNGDTPGTVNALVIQETGKVAFGGSFTTVNGEPRNNIARIEGAMPQSLAQLSGSLVEWSRLGLPPAVSTAFDLSTDSGATWTTIDATGTFVNGVWQGTITTPLPAAGGLLRGRAVIAGGYYSEMIYQTNFAPPAPKIVVEQPVNTVLDDDDTINLGTLGINVLVPTVFTIRNGGGQNLTLGTLTFSGPNANQFSIIAQPATTVAPLESTTFTLQAKVTSAGAKTATLNIPSNDTTTTPFNIVLNVTGATAVPPVATTVAATGLDFIGTSVNAMRATLNGTVDANGQPREVSFEYGLTTAYGTTITLPNTFNSANPENVSTQLTGLAPHTTYNFRVRIDGDLGNALGTNRSFTTANRPPVANPDTVKALPSSATTIDVLDDDTDADGDTLTIASRTAVSPSTAGTVAIVSNKLVFTASAAFGTAPNLTATFGYKVSDGEGGLTDGTVSVSLGNAGLDLLTKSIAAEGTAFETPSSYPVEITTTGSWAVTEALSWATASPMSGREIAIVNITVQPNTTTASRIGIIKIGGVSHTITQAGTVKPTLGPLTNTAYQAIVGGAFELVIPTVNAPVTYTTTGMPPGLTLSNTTGKITGRPTMTGTTPTTYTVTVRASNASGPISTDTAGRAAAFLTFTIQVIPLPAGVVGTFHGLIERSSTVNIGTIPNLGARWQMTVDALGGVTGKISEGVTTRSFEGDLEVTPATANSPTLSAQVDKTALTLKLKLDATTDSLSSGIGENVLHNAGNTQSSVVTGWGNAWSTTIPIKRATQFRGPYSFAITNPATTTATNPAAPDGFGFGSFIVNETTGTLRITGDLPDGSKILCDTFIGQNGEVLLYTPLHGNKGSIHGKLTVTPVNAPTDNSVEGPLTWLKPALLATDRDKSYQSGFAPLTLEADGSTYLPPAKGQRVLGLPAPALTPTTATNAKLAFTLGGLDLATPNSLAFNQLIRVNNPSTTGLTNTATVVPFNATTLTNPNRVAITTFTAPTGAFAGNFTLPGTPARNAPFAGQIVRSSGITKGYGYFLLPSVPVAPQTVSTSPRLSGRVELTAP
jgi:uncharacterized delta-60 repeat protein